MAVITDDFIIQSQYELDVPDSDLFSYLNEQVIGTEPSKLCLIEAATGRTMTYGELRQHTESIHATLHGCGVSRGSRVLFFIPNCIQYVPILLAVLKTGACPILLNSLAQKEELARSLKVSSATFLLTLTSRAESVKNDTQNDQNLFDICQTLDDISLLKASKSQSPAMPEMNFRRVDPVQDTAIMLFSSGTTGLPKVVESTHRNVMSQLQVRMHRSSGYPDYQTTIVYQPLAYGAGMLLTFLTLLRSATAVIMTRFSIEEYIQLISKYKVTTLVCVPSVSVSLVRGDLLKKYDLSCVRDIVSGTAPLAPQIADDLIRCLPNVNMIRQVYGLTESSGAVVTTAKTQPSPPFSVGIPAPGIQVKIISDKGETLSDGKEGEICLRGVHVMKGYLGNPEATRKTIDKQGWLHTGDAGFFDKKGFIYVVDRLKELIKYSGFQVAPAELESILLTHPAVAEAGVTGIPNIEKGELPAAGVVLKPGHEMVTAQEIQKFVDNQVAPYKKLRGGISFMDTIPKSRNGKLLRRELRQLFSKNISKM